MRHVIFALAASLVTLLLFLIMIGLVWSDPPQAPAFEPTELVTFVPAKLDSPQPRVVSVPPPPVEPPPPLDFAQAPTDVAALVHEMDFEPGPFKSANHGAIPLVVVDPVYPIEALRDGTTGWVRLQFTIEPDGSVGELFVVEAAPRRGVFDSVALHAVASSHFIPKTINGVAVPSRAEWTFNFSTDGKQEIRITPWNDVDESVPIPVKYEVEFYLEEGG